jgi:hypothetical protein
MNVDHTYFQKLIATPKLELNFKRVAWVKIKKTVPSTPCRHIQEGKVRLHPFFGTTAKLVISFTPRPLHPWQRTPGNY